MTATVELAPPPETCRWGCVPECSTVAVKATVIIYPCDHTMRERSKRRMCQPCFDWLKQQPEVEIKNKKTLDPAKTTTK